MAETIKTVVLKLEYKVRRMRRGKRTQDKKLAAFIGATNEARPEFGIGLMDREGGVRFFYGQSYPHSLVAAWRSVMLLDGVEMLYQDTVRQCYFAGRREKTQETVSCLRALGGQIADIGERREELLREKIPGAILDKMLAVCNDGSNCIEVEIGELEEELELGRISITPELTRALELAIAKAKSRMYYVEAAGARPLTEPESLRELCLKAGIQNLCGEAREYYDLESVYCDLDEQLIYNGESLAGHSLGHLVGHSSGHSFGLELYCTDVRDAQNYAVYGHPVVRLKDGREAVLMKAFYDEGEIWLMTSVAETTLGTSKTDGLVAARNAQPVTEVSRKNFRVAEMTKLKPRMVGISPDGDVRNYVPVEATVDPEAFAEDEDETGVGVHEKTGPFETIWKMIRRLIK